MTDAGNDRWRGCFDVAEIVEHAYTVVGWIDRFETWRRDLRKKVDAGVDVAVDLLVGAELVKAAARRAEGDDRERLRVAAKTARRARTTTAGLRVALDEGLRELASAYSDRRTQGAFERELRVVVDRPKARFSAWYELFPRSASPEPGRHGTFADVIARLPYVAGMGFDVLYLPPIHPIGASASQGPEQRRRPREPGDPGSPWAIGAAEGGHTAIHPGARHARRLRRAWSRAAAEHGHRDRARHRVPVLARPPVGRASIPSGSATGPTARSSTPRTRRRSTRTSIPFDFETRRTGGRCGRSSRGVVRVLDRAGRADLPRRQPAHQAVRVLGVADRASCKRDAPRRDLPGRGVHPAEGDVPPGQARLHAVVHVLHVAQRRSGS